MQQLLKIAMFLIAHRDEVAALEAEGEQLYEVITKIVQGIRAAKAEAATATVK